jgi:hypothetical protein
VRVRLVVLALAVGISCSATAPVARASTFQIPGSIAGDCSVDVTQPILTWIASVPDDSTLNFSEGACYRLSGTLELANRHGLDLEGNGATFTFTPGGDPHRAAWRLDQGSDYTFRDMTIIGANPAAGVFNPLYQWQHGFDFRGTATATVDHVAVADVYGDCFYLGQAVDGSRAWSSGIHIAGSTCHGSGRMGVAITAARGVLIEQNTISQAGIAGVDIEPNGGSLGFGAHGVTIASNEIDCRETFDAIGKGPVTAVAVRDNRVTGYGLHMVVRAPTGERRSNFTIAGNVSDTGYYAPGSDVMDFARIDGLVVTGNTAPVSGPNMALAWVADSSQVVVFGNSFPGGVAEVRYQPSIASFTPALGGKVSTRVTINGAHFRGATSVTFHRVPAPFSVISSHEIVARVPRNATTGAIRVRTPGGTATSVTRFRVPIR